MRWILTLLFPFTLSAQNADWVELQGKIDSARTSPTGIVTVARNYTIDKPLIVANWTGKDYSFVNLTIQGYATMWDNNGRSLIRATFDNAPIISIHKGKGVIVRGVNFQGPRVGRDSRYSPQAAIAVDPFRYDLPPDGGYPTLQEWYRGPKSVSGSTGIRVEDCTFNNVTVGFITSPNGFTLNAELISLTNIRSYNVKHVIVGCQAQEKMNRVTNLGAWGPSETVFRFNSYGQGHPGNWIIDGVNIAGSVKQLIHRASNGFFPMFMSNVFAENIESIGYWQTTVGDALSFASINFKSPAKIGYYPDAHLETNGQGPTISNSNIRYYGGDIPILFKGAKIQSEINNTGGMINATKDLSENTVKQIGRVYGAVLDGRSMSVLGSGVVIGQTVILMDLGNWVFCGMAEVDSLYSGGYRLKYVSNSVKQGGNYRIGAKIN